MEQQSLLSNNGVDNDVADVLSGNHPQHPGTRYFATSLEENWQGNDNAMTITTAAVEATIHHCSMLPALPPPPPADLPGNMCLKGHDGDIYDDDDDAEIFLDTVPTTKNDLNVYHRSSSISDNINRRKLTTTQINKNPNKKRLKLKHHYHRSSDTTGVFTNEETVSSTAIMNNVTNDYQLSADNCDNTNDGDGGDKSEQEKTRPYVQYFDGPLLSSVSSCGNSMMHEEDLDNDIDTIFSFPCNDSNDDTGEIDKENHHPCCLTTPDIIITETLDSDISYTSCATTVVNNGGGSGGSGSDTIFSFFTPNNNNNNNPLQQQGENMMIFSDLMESIDKTFCTSTVDDEYYYDPDLNIGFNMASTSSATSPIGWNMAITNTSSYCNNKVPTVVSGNINNDNNNNNNNGNGDDDEKENMMYRIASPVPGPFFPPPTKKKTTTKDALFVNTL